ncbi:MAG TPA: FecR family protein [Kofleriaceae bacterium]|nr:FecR family protein [Kofleriaceae bacterium]
MKPRKPIVVDVPTSEARRERVEREVFARLDAMRDLDRVTTMSPTKPRRAPWLVIGFAFAATAATAAVLVAREAPTPKPSAPSLVVTPVGGSSRFTVGDAVIDAGSDTSVEVEQASNGTTTLYLARGVVDCDVLPRPNRAPFRVIAGDVTVEVVGTRFEVTRGGLLTRVDVARGKVKVHGNGELRYVNAGESWSSQTTTAVVTTPTPTERAQATAQEIEPEIEPEIEIELPPEPARPAKPALSPQAQYEAALVIKSEAKRARAYRTVANGNHAWAALSLFNLAELQAKSNVDATLATLDELQRRFPHASNAEDAAWYRVDVLRDARRTDEAKRAAAAYLRAFPQGTYAKLAARLVRPSGP